MDVVHHAPLHGSINVLSLFQKQMPQHLSPQRYRRHVSIALAAFIAAGPLRPFVLAITLALYPITSLGLIQEPACRLQGMDQLHPNGNVGSCFLDPDDACQLAVRCNCWGCLSHANPQATLRCLPVRYDVIR